jgi:hypothetical protein
MFIYSIKASTLKVIALCTVCLIALVVLLNAIPTYEPNASSLQYTEVGSYNFTGIKTNEDRIEFLSQFGWTVDALPVEDVTVTIPNEFDKVYVGYNDLQKQQGLDLSKYKNKEVKRYTYKLTNYPDYEGTVYANILVYRGRVIAGDICSADVNGFAQTLDGKIDLP